MRRYGPHWPITKDTKSCPLTRVLCPQPTGVENVGRAGREDEVRSCGVCIRLSVCLSACLSTTAAPHHAPRAPACMPCRPCAAEHPWAVGHCICAWHCGVRIHVGDHCATAAAVTRWGAMGPLGRRLRGQRRRGDSLRMRVAWRERRTLLTVRDAVAERPCCGKRSRGCSWNGAEWDRVGRTGRPDMDLLSLGCVCARLRMPPSRYMLVSARADDACLAWEGESECKSHGCTSCTDAGGFFCQKDADCKKFVRPPRRRTGRTPSDLIRPCFRVAMAQWCRCMFDVPL